jgi:hypothetical protein
MGPPRTTQEEEEFLERAKQLWDTDPSLVEFLTRLRPYANNRQFVAAFTRETGHQVPAFLVQPQGETLAALTAFQSGGLADQTSQEDWLAFCRYVVKFHKAGYLLSPQEAPLPALAARYDAADYDEDFYAWSQATAQALRAGQWNQINREAVAEEIESLGKRDKRELGSRLEVLVLHLLKWRFQPAYRQQSHSWQDTILEQRRRLARLLDDSPSLRQTVPDELRAGYPAARQRTSLQTGLPLATFPEACPWMPEKVLDDEFWPEE